MNAITVNYAEIDNNSVPRSFGLAYTSLLTNGGFFVDGVSHIFNASVKELTGTPYSLVQGRNFDYDKDIIVTTASPSSTSLNALQGVKNQTWINFYQPTWDNDSFIWLDYNPETGKFYTMIEKDTFPDEKEIGYSVQVSRVLENENGCYNQVALTTKAALASAADANKVIIKHNGLVLFTLDSTLKALKENANDDNFVTLSNSIADNYQVDEYASYIDPALTVWTHEGTEVTPGIELVSGSGVVKKYAESVSGDQHLYQVLTGNNEVKFYRKRKDLVVNFTFTGLSFSYADASCNNRDNSYQESVSQLVIPSTKYGKTNIKFEDYFTNSSKLQFSPTSIAIFKGSSPVSCTVTVSVGSVTDTIYYTGCLNDGSYVSNKQYLLSHDILATDYALNEITLNKVSSITTDSTYLTHNPGTRTFRRHREIKRRYQEWWLFVGWIDKSNVRETIYYLDDNQQLTDVRISDGKRYVYSYADSNNNPRQFYATATYSDIPAAVSVTIPSSTAQATNDQVVLFRDKYYVANDDMKNLVKRLVPSATVTKKTVWEEEQDKPWTVTHNQSFWYVTPNYKDVTNDGVTTQVFDGYNYEPKVAEITIKGTSSNVTSMTSSDTHLSVQFNQAIKDADNNLKVEYTCSVTPAAIGEQEGYSLSDAALTSTLGANTLIPNGTWNKKVTVTYKFFN